MMEDTIIVKIPEKFDYSKNAEFKAAYSDKSTKNTFILDFSETRYIDSASLGMLLLLKEYTGGSADKIQFIHCSPEIMKFFKICHFDKMFNITEKI